MNLQCLNEAQREAVTSTEGFVRLIAGAGSGKTRALSYRFAYLVNEIGIMPGNILCVTFTNKSANEMKQRIRTLTGDNDTGYISTFHGFCVSVLQEDSHGVSYPKSFIVLDNADINSVLEIIYEERGLTMRHMTYGQARDMIEIRKLKKEPEYYKDMITMSLEQVYEKYLAATKPDDIIFYGYLYHEKKCFGLDFNDLIKFVLFIFQEHEDIRLKWQERLEYIMIDEFQDIDEPQYQLMEVLCDYHKNLFVVGDPDQTIYTWRGADIRYLLDFDKKFPDVKTIMMMENYRSTPGILAVANSLISKNKNRMEKNLVPVACEHNSDGGGDSVTEIHNQNSKVSATVQPRVMPDFSKVVFSHSKTAEDEAIFIASSIKNLVEKGVPLSDITVLFRAHYISRNIEEVFQKKEIPYTLFSGVPFLERIEIKDALSYLRMVAYKDDVSFLRVVNAPKRNIGKQRITLLTEYQEKNGGSLYEALKILAESDSFKNTKAKDFIELIEKYNATYATKQISDLLSFILHESGYEKALRTEGCQERLDNLAELKQAIYEYEISCGEECTLEHYVSHLALFSSVDMGTVKNAVKMMTIHTAKGLEFPYVFLCGMNENMFPSKKINNAAAMEEERRLAFVAFTRAEKGLFLSDAEGFVLAYGFRFPSRFIFDVDSSLLEFTTELDESFIADANRYIKASEEALEIAGGNADFAEGDRIEHGILGKGVILEIDEVRHSYVIQFDTMKTPRKLNMKSPIKKI